MSEEKKYLEQYYKETDPMKRKELLEQSIAAGEDPAGNPIRMELWEARYREKSQNKNERADGFLKLRMVMNYAGDNSTGIFGYRGVKRDIRKALKKLNFEELKQKDEATRKLLYKECYHMGQLYLYLCENDRTYGSTLLGMMALNKEKLQDKIGADIFNVACKVPTRLEMEEELEPLLSAVIDAYIYTYPQERRSLEERIDSWKNK